MIENRKNDGDDDLICSHNFDLTADLVNLFVSQPITNVFLKNAVSKNEIHASPTPRPPQ